MVLHLSQFLLAGHLLLHQLHEGFLAKPTEFLLKAEDDHTEWQIFLATMLELVLRVAELLPKDTIQLADALARISLNVLTHGSPALAVSACPSGGGVPSFAHYTKLLMIL